MSLGEGRLERWGPELGEGVDLASVPACPAPLPARFLSCQRSPAAAILELFEEQNGSLQELQYLMTLMERLDCASVIQSYLSRTQGSSPAPARGGAWENQGLELELQELDEKL